MRRAIHLSLVVAATAALAACTSPTSPAAPIACRNGKILYGACVNKDYVNPVGDYVNPVGDYVNPVGDDSTSHPGH